MFLTLSSVFEARVARHLTWYGQCLSDNSLDNYIYSLCITPWERYASHSVEVSLTPVKAVQRLNYKISFTYHVISWIAPNSSCGKVMFSQVSVCPQGGCTPLRRHPPGRYPPRQTPPWADPSPEQTPSSLGRHPPLPPPEMPTAADGTTHPTGMHSCDYVVTWKKGNNSPSYFVLIFVANIEVLHLNQGTKELHLWCLGRQCASEIVALVFQRL